MLFAFFLTEMVGLEPSRMGAVLAVGLMVSAVIDLGVGVGLRRERFDAASAARLQFVGASVCAITFVAVFLGFWAPAEWRFAYAIVAGLTFRVAYALYDVPQNALMALATRDAAGRDRVASTRIWFSGLATLLVAAAIGPLIAGRDEVAAGLYVGLAVAMAAPAVFSAGLLARLLGSRGTNQSLSVGEIPEPGHGIPLRSPLFWLLMALMLVTSLATPLFSKIEPFFAVYVLRSAAWGGFIIVAMAVGVIAGQPLWRLICARASHVTALWTAAVLQLLGLGTIAAASPNPASAIVVAAFTFGLGNGGVGMVLWAAFSDVVAREAKGHEGFAYGLFTAVAKLALALGGLGLGLALAGIDYRGAESGDLTVLMTSLPAVGAMLCLIISIFWSKISPTDSR